MGSPTTALYALSSDLTGSAAAAVSYLWDILEARFGVAAMTEQPPHLTYLVGECPDIPKRDLLLRSVAIAARSLPAFSLELDGLSSFDGEAPILFLRVVRHETLIDVHDSLFRAAVAAGMEVDSTYHPGKWTPHCVLAVRDLSPAQLPAIRDFLRAQPLIWRCPINRIDLFRRTESVHEFVESWPLSAVLDMPAAPVKPQHTRLLPLQQTP